jgi:predicted RNase H-like HicB family nuclease
MVARRKKTPLVLNPVAPADEARMMIAVYGPKGAYPFPNPPVPPHALSAVIVKEDGLYIAQCLDVDESSFGRTPAQALRRLREAVHIHYEELARQAAIPSSVAAQVQGLATITL